MGANPASPAEPAAGVYGAVHTHAGMAQAKGHKRKGAWNALGEYNVGIGNRVTGADGTRA